MDISVGRGRGRGVAVTVAGRRRGSARRRGSRRGGSTSITEAGHASAEAGDASAEAGDASGRGSASGTDSVTEVGDASVEAGDVSAEAGDVSAEVGDASGRGSASGTVSDSVQKRVNINNMRNYQYVLQNAAKTCPPTSPMKIHVGAVIRDTQYDAIKKEVDKINKKLGRKALKIVNKRVGKDVKGEDRAVMQGMRSAEKAHMEKIGKRSGESIFS